MVGPTIRSFRYFAHHLFTYTQAGMNVALVAQALLRKLDANVLSEIKNCTFHKVFLGILMLASKVCSSVLLENHQNSLTFPSQEVIKEPYPYAEWSDATIIPGESLWFSVYLVEKIESEFMGLMQYEISEEDIRYIPYPKQP